MSRIQKRSVHDYFNEEKSGDSFLNLLKKTKRKKDKYSDLSSSSELEIISDEEKRNKTVLINRNKTNSDFTLKDPLDINVIK